MGPICFIKEEPRMDSNEHEMFLKGKTYKVVCCVMEFFGF